MSIFGSMKTSVSGMNAQANRLSTVSDNIANVNTTGYKAVSTAFSTFVLPSTPGNYNSGGVETSVRQSVSEQGGLQSTTSSTNLAISGDGFFIVQGADGVPVLTRAGDFQQDKDGNLTNSAGFTLMGYPYGSGSPSVVVNGFTGLVPVNVQASTLQAAISTSGEWTGNLDAKATVVDPTASPSQLPGDNPAAATVTADTKKLSMVGYDAIGTPTMYDFYFTKTADTPNASGGSDTSWQVAVFRHSDASTGTSAFPYGSAAVSTGTLTFDPSGKLSSATPATDTNIVDPVTGATITMNYSKLTQLSSDFSLGGKMDGQAANAVKDVKIGADGVVTASYTDGSTRSLFQIPLATVPSPDNLTLESGNVYSTNGNSGITLTAFPNTSGLGKLVAGSIESSNVDLAGELTEMIEAQRSYTANSKVFQTGADIMDVLVNLKR
ncbi:flagellar hook protein FlgE [Oryzifoliimicrobium ureilyticus]|uniref:flagellar hook protein FlgE n=1 Tax=Oryzifoliimicrobium ureilyticus TaxID=3113724 RepID=UPI0030763240